MKRLMKNIKTTLFGAVAGLPILFEGIVTKDIGKILAGAGALLTGLFAKDAEK
jgi:hypothetical protein